MTVVEKSQVQDSGAELIRTGLLGRSILASRSPWMHEQEAQAQSIALQYALFDFTANGWRDEELGLRLDEIAACGFAGVNVTHPFKQAIVPLLDDLSPAAASVGAVNTVRFANGKRIGHNTDMTGFADSVRAGLGGVDLGRVVQFGAGGAGSATAHALLDLGIRELFLVDADDAKAETLAGQLALARPDARIVCAKADAVLFNAVDGVVNATPIGMAAHPGMPFDPDWLRSAHWLADIVYFPLETELLKAARGRGCRTLDGRGMAVYQAAEAFDVFTNRHADRARMLASFDAFQYTESD